MLRRVGHGNSRISLRWIPTLTLGMTKGLLPHPIVSAAQGYCGKAAVKFSLCENEILTAFG